MGKNKFFTVMVVGENPTEMMSKYEIGLKVEPYKKFKYLDAEKMQKNCIKVLSEMINNYENFNLSKYHVDYLKEKLKKIKEMSSFDYYSMISYGLYYDDNGDAWCDVNPNGKWTTFKIGKDFSNPLKLIDDGESYSAYNKDIDWDAMHLNNTHTYEVVWEMIMEGREPKTDEEKTLFENMQNLDNYFSTFKNVDEYVIHNCAYWNYAVLNDSGWHDMDDDGNEKEWIKNFFDKYVSTLNDNDKITIFECTREEEN